MTKHITGKTVVEDYYLNAPFNVDSGLDTYNPPISSQILTFLQLQNVEPRLGRLVATAGDALLQDFLTDGEVIFGYAYTLQQDRRYADLYAFTNTSIYWFNFSTGLFVATPIYTGFPNSTLPYACLPWYGALYVTKPYAGYVKLVHNVATVVANVPSARYGIIATSHAYLGGVADDINNSGDQELARLRWSDLYLPESFIIDASSSEADFFDLEPDSREVTGLSYQNYSPLVYAQNAIWQGTWIGFPGGFKHINIFPGLGNIFHDSLIRNGATDYFIGLDNIYQLNGLQPTGIGQFIFQRFINDVVIVPSTSVRGYLDTRRFQAFWVYNSIKQGGTQGSPVYWAIVYNYLEQYWSERDPQNLSAFFDAPRTMLRGYDCISDIATLIVNDHNTFYDPNNGYPLAVKQLTATKAANGHCVASYANQTQQLKQDGTQFPQVMETFDFYFGNFNFTKEVTKCNLEYSFAGNPNLTVAVCSRSNQGQAIVYGTPVPVTDIDGSNSFFIRSQGVGKYLRFKFTWNNTATDYISDIRLLSFVRVDNTPEDNPEK